MVYNDFRITFTADYTAIQLFNDMKNFNSLGALNLIFALICFTFLNGSALSQTDYIVQVEPQINPKDALSELTKNIDYTSRYILDSSFRIRSREGYTLSDFENQLIGSIYSIVSFEKNDRVLDPSSNDENEKACCSITIDMDDSFGDDWNGGFLTVTIDGVATTHSATGSGTIDNVAYCDGQTLVIEYTSGSWEGDNSYTISTPAGTLISDGPNPTTGLVFQSSNACSSTAPTPTSQDCEGSTLVCSNNSFSGNSNGSGFYNDLNAGNEGCLNGENQTSWYYVNVGTSGTLSMVIVPSNGSDDYDFAIWGPFDETTANANCPPITAPVRCNYAAYPRSWGCGTNTNPTGMSLNASLPTTTSACPNRPFVRHLDVLAGEVYLLVIDNYSGSSQPFDLNWGGTAGLDCTTVPLPVELVDFNGVNNGVENQLQWSTQSELNNDYFSLQYSVDGIHWKTIKTLEGAGTTSEEQLYSTSHRDFEIGVNYYRLEQFDYDGTKTTHKTISIDNSSDLKLIKRINTLGQEVGKDYKGIVIEYYQNGTVRKYFKH